MQNNDYNNRDQLVKEFEDTKQTICDTAENEWEKVSIALGIAEYDPENESSATDTMRRADKFMYENKRIQKAAKAKK